MKPFSKLRELLEKSTARDFSKGTNALNSFILTHDLEVFHKQLPRVLEALDVAVEALEWYDGSPKTPAKIALTKIKEIGESK